MKMFERQKEYSEGDDRVDYKAIVSTINEGVIVIQDGKLVFANPAFARLTGKSVSEIIGAPFVDLVASSHKNVVMEFVSAFGQTVDEQSKIEFMLDGTPGKLAVMKMRFGRHDQQNAYVGHLIDVTETRKKTIEAQRLHNRLRSILDSIHHVVLSFSFNEATDKTKLIDTEFYDAHLVEMNPAADVLYGVPREAFLGKASSIFDFVHADDKNKVLRYYKNLHIKGSGWLTYRVTRSDHEIRWVLDYGKVEYQKNKRVRRVNHIIEDITAKKKALDELKANERKYRRIFERSKDMIYIVDHDGRFIDINPAGLKLLGLISKEEAAFRNIKEFYVDQRAREALLKELVEKGEASSNRVMLWKTKGEVIEVDLNAIAKRDGSAKMVSYQGIVTNITEALRQRELESIAQLAGCFADDLASPLNTIMINLGVTEDVLTELKQNTPVGLEGEKTLANADTDKKIGFQVEELIDFNQSAKIACKDIAARLKEIREEYWRLNKVPDGTGGSIYERQSKRSFLKNAS